jgi:hypothetical protein
MFSTVMDRLSATAFRKTSYWASTSASKTRAGWQTLRTFFYTHDLGLLKPAAGGESLRFPYAAAIALGFLAHARWGALIPI